MKILKTTQYNQQMPVEAENPQEAINPNTKKFIELLNELKSLDSQFTNEVRFRETNQYLYDYISKKFSYIIGNLSHTVINQIGEDKKSNTQTDIQGQI